MASESYFFFSFIDYFKHVYIHIYIYVCLYIYMYIYVYVCIYIYIYIYTVNVDIFACINFRVFTKMGNFAWIKIRVLRMIGSLGYY